MNPVKFARRAVARLLDGSWSPVGLIDSWRLSRQLSREIAPGHRMHGRKWHAVARNTDSDDVLFVSDTGEIADVHLTWGTPRDGTWPTAGFHESVESFASWLAEERAHAVMIEAQVHSENRVVPGTVVCRSCGADWGQGHVSHDCPECGGFALVCTCPVCGGSCPAIWERAIMDSNDSGEAHWIGTCAKARRI